MNGLMARLSTWSAGLFSRAGGGASLQTASDMGLPVNLGSYDYAKNNSAQGKIQNIDQALVWVVVALLMWGMVMVYSASIAMPDNPKFARYSQTHFVMRHIISIVIGFGVALLAFQVPLEMWEKKCATAVHHSLGLAGCRAVALYWQRCERCASLDFSGGDEFSAL